MEVNAKKVPSGETATFTGTLGTKAQKNLKSWTNGDNIVCLSRYATKPEADGSWGGANFDAACTTVRKNGGFTITRNLVARERITTDSKWDRVARRIKANVAMPIRA